MSWCSLNCVSVVVGVLVALWWCVRSVLTVFSDVLGILLMLWLCFFGVLAAFRWCLGGAEGMVFLTKSAHLSIPHSHHHHQAKFPHTILPPHSPHMPEVSSMCRFKYADISGSPNLFLDLSFPCTYSCFHFSTINLSICLYFYQFVCMYLFTHGSIYINGSIQKDLCKTLSSTRLKAYKGFSTSEVRLL